MLAPLPPADAADPAAALRVARLPFDHPVASDLVAAVQAVYIERYGGPDETPLRPGEFDPPNGGFLVAHAGDVPVGCAGWRFLGPGLAEVKRMFVVPAHRGRGVSRVLLAALEHDARTAGASRMCLQTGDLLVEALGLYRASAGWEPIDGYGHYGAEPGCFCFGKSLA